MGTEELMETEQNRAVMLVEMKRHASGRSLADIRSWLTGYLAFLLDENPEAVDTELSFDSHGLDSAAAVSLVGDLEDWMGIELDPTIVYDYPTVSALADYLMAKQIEGAAG